jgi:hypothetical protein
MSVWTKTVIATPENVDRPSSSASTTVASVSISEPPYCAGYRMPRKPSSPMRRSTSRGTIPSCSHCNARGLISSSTKRRIWARSNSCSSPK